MRRQHADVTSFASILLWFFLLLLLDRHVFRRGGFLVRRGGFLVRRRGGWRLLLLLRLRRWWWRLLLLLVLRRWWWGGIPVPLGALLRLQIPWPLVLRLLLQLQQLPPVRLPVLLPVLPVLVPLLRRTLRFVQPRVLRRILQQWRQLRGHSL